MDVAGNSWSFRCSILLEDALRVTNYSRWVWIGVSSCVNGSWSQNVVFQQSNLTLLVNSIMADVVMGSGLPVESYVNQDNQQAYWSPVESLIFKELWSRQVEGFWRGYTVHHSAYLQTQKNLTRDRLGGLLPDMPPLKEDEIWRLPGPFQTLSKSMKQAHQVV